MQFLPTDHPRYKWQPAHDFTLRLRALRGYRGRIGLTDRAGRELASLVDNQITVRAAYAFDGCTFAPDFETALRGCCVHDVLLQLLASHPRAFPRRAAHAALREVHRRDRFVLAAIYYLAVLAWPFQQKI